MTSLVIDGKKVEFNAGESILEVAQRHAIDIPYYCWHPELSIAANCRMCLVEVKKAPKLLPACQTECRDGMVVKTQSEMVSNAQKAIHELLLINHPIDCPICDQAGECKLQNYYMKYQLTSSRMHDEKEHKPRCDALGPTVMYNAERCVLCTRCIRFMEEVAGQKQLGVYSRGNRAFIGTFPNQPLDNPYAMNTVDVCPVGALTSRVFRFKQRVWNLTRSPGICPGCAKGCNIYADHRSGQVYRFVPRENNSVNTCWICDEGRLTYACVNSARLYDTQLREAQNNIKGASEEGLWTRIQHWLSPLAESQQGFDVGLTYAATCEEAYVLGRIAKSLFGCQKIVVLSMPDGEGDNFLRQVDRNPNRRGIEMVLADLGLTTIDVQDLKQRTESGQTKGLIIYGQPGVWEVTLLDILNRIEIFLYLGYAENELSHKAHVVLPTLPWLQSEGTWVNCDGIWQHFNPAFVGEGQAKTAIEWLCELACCLGFKDLGPSLPTIRTEMIEKLDSFKKGKEIWFG